MNDEQSGGVEDRRESELSDSSSAADNNDDYEEVRPPDNKKFQGEMHEILEGIRDLETKLKSLEKQMSSSNTRDVVPIDREQLISELTNLRAQRERVIEERKQFDLELKGLNMQVQKKNDACTKLQAGVRYKSEARIDEAVRRLEHQMQAQQLKLSEEKRLVAEIDILKRSKRKLNEYLVLKQHVDQLRNRQTKLRSQRDACVKRINGLKSREEETKTLLDSDVANGAKESQNQHFEQLNEIEVLKQELDKLHTKKRNLRASFTKKRNEYYAAVKEMRSQKKKEELERRKKERLGMLKEMESKRGKQKPYEKEQALCGKLIGLFEKQLHANAFHLSDVHVSTSPEKEPALLPGATAGFSKSDGEGTFLRRKSSTDDLVGVFAGFGRTPRRGSRKGRRSSAKEVPRKLNLHPEVVENLLALHLSPPSTAADIPKVLEELQEKKDFYENSLTSHEISAPQSNDPMSPISEEGPHEFPNTFTRSNETETSGDAVQPEDMKCTGVGNDTREADKGNRIELCSTEVEVTQNEYLNKPYSNNSSSLSLKAEGEVESLRAELQEALPSHEHSVLETELARIDSGIFEANLSESASPHKPARVSNELQSDMDMCNPLCPTLGLDEGMANSVNRDSGSHKEQTVSNQKDGIISRESSLVTELQNHPCFTNSSPCNSSLLVDENNLDVAFDRNSLNESGSGMVKIHCEKCPA